MITKWGLKNFKSIHEAELELAPLTVITGVNSSGKSSLLQSMAMLVQSARNADKTFPFLNGDIEKGDIVNLGSYKHIFYNKADDKSKIEIDFTMPLENQDVNVKFELESKLAYIDTSFYMECKEKEKKKGVFIKYPTGWNEIGMDSVSAAEVERENKFDDELEIAKIDFKRPYIFIDHLFRPHPVKISFNLEYKEEYMVRFNKFLELLKKIPHEKLATREEAQKYEEKMISEQGIDKDFIEDLLFYTVNTARLDKDPYPFDENFKGLFITYKDKDGNFDFELSDWYRIMSGLNEQEKEILIEELNSEDFCDFMWQLWNDYIDSSTKEVELPAQLKRCRDHFQEYFRSKINYLGPLRKEPKDAYDDKIKYDEKNVDELRKIASDVGFKGERTAAVITLWHNHHWMVTDYYSPANLDKIEKPKNDLRLIDTLKDCMRHIVIADDIIAIKLQDEKDNKDEKYEIKLIIDGEAFYLTQLGTGVSQVLPVLVMCLTTEPGSTIIIQNPEEQLHPKIQSKLADFFIAMALSGRQCIIETHSEHIINALRHRIVTTSSQDDKKLADDIRIYFVEKDENGSQFKPITINEYGAISDWPEDFFDESSKTADEIFNAAIFKWEKRKK